MILGFIDFTFIDLLDIILVAYIIYQLYYLIRGTVAIKIFVGILAIYLLWKLVTALQMEMLGELLGQFIGVGVIALLIVFQQELRQFLLFIGNTDFLNKYKVPKFIKKYFPKSNLPQERDYSNLVNACFRMSKNRVGALIVIANNSDPMNYIRSYETLEANISTALIESIFQKESPLHDGAIVVKYNKILVASAILPVSEAQTLKGSFGTRHRAAIGLSELIDAYVIIVSEETGNVSLAFENTITMYQSAEELRTFISKKP